MTRSAIRLWMRQYRTDKILNTSIILSRITQKTRTIRTHIKAIENKLLPRQLLKRIIHPFWIYENRKGKQWLAHSDFLLLNLQLIEEKAID